MSAPPFSVALRSPVLLLIALIPLALALPWFGVPLDRDEAAYAVIARGMSRGLVPYRDLFDHKPPLLYALYWVAAGHGDGVWQPRLLSALSLSATALIVVATARALGASEPASYVAGVLFGLSNANVFLHANANAEALMLPWMTASLLAALLAAHGRSAAAALLAGLLAAAAVLIKTTAIWPALALVVWLACSPDRRRLGVSFAVGFAAPIAIAAGIFAALGAASDAWYANITYNRLYAAAIPAGERISNALSLSTPVLLGGAAFWLLALAGLVVSLRKRTSHRWLMLAWAFAAFAGVKSTGRDFSHYYVQLLPAAALLGVPAIDGLAGVWSRRPVRLAAYALATSALFWQTALYWASVQSPADRVRWHSENAQVRACEAGAPEIAAWLRPRLAPGDQMYNLGRDTELYFYAGRTPPVRLMYDRPFFLDAPAAGEAARDLRAASPRWIVETEQACGINQPAPAVLRALVDERYTHVATVGYAEIYELRP